jgi:hypothetical protein
MLTDNYSTKSDVFSFGILLGEIWGKHPFDHFSSCQSNFEIVMALEKRNLIPSLPQTPCPREISELISQCIAWEVSDRPNFQEILTRLKKVVLHP